ncbi:MAG: linear amide C-N hydrolase [Kofleriaceae bacterium]|nr:linear amide C-N hydrolase [Kofleriaceae bacterium]
MSRPLTSLLACALATSIVAAPIATACTRVLWNDNDKAVLVARTMDWPESTQPEIIVFPRGIERDGGHLGPVLVVKNHPLVWTSKYGSIVTGVYGLGAADGFNERGLGAHMLYLNATDFGPRDESKPGVQAGLWAQYLLDTAATVEEALALIDQIQPVMVEHRGRKATVHLALEDATGDSAIVEYIDGKPIIHHGRDYTVMTNDPPYDQQLALLKKQDLSKPSSELALPGNVNPRDRFVRATYFRSLLPEPKTEREAVASMFAIARNVSVPFGAPYKNMGVYDTEYRTVMDLTNKRYFFELTTTPNVIWIDLTKVSLKRGAPVRMLHPDDVALSGDVTAKLKRVAKAPF